MQSSNRESGALREFQSAKVTVCSKGKTKSSRLHKAAHCFEVTRTSARSGAARSAHSTGKTKTMRMMTREHIKAETSKCSACSYLLSIGF